MNTRQKDEMKTSNYLSQEEKKERRQQLIFYNICLIAGSILILFSLIYLLQNLGNNSVYWIGFVGICCAIPFYIIYGLGMKSIKNKTSSDPKKRNHKSD